MEAPLVRTDFGLVLAPFGVRTGLVLAFRERARTPLPFEGVESIFKPRTRAGTERARTNSEDTPHAAGHHQTHREPPAYPADGLRSLPPERRARRPPLPHPGCPR